MDATINKDICPLGYNFIELITNNNGKVSIKEYEKNITNQDTCDIGRIVIINENGLEYVDYIQNLADKPKKIKDIKEIKWIDDNAKTELINFIIDLGT